MKNGKPKKTWKEPKREPQTRRKTNTYQNLLECNNWKNLNSHTKWTVAQLVPLGCVPLECNNLLECNTR
jgi:hypothetical protein